MINLIVSDRLVDVDVSQGLPLSFQGADLLDLSGRSDAYSDTWELPATANNLDVFGCITLATGDLTSATVMLPCQIYQGNSLLLSGYCIVTETAPDKIKVEITGAIGGVFGADADRLITSLDLGDLGVWDPDSFNDGITSNTSLIRYALCDNGVLANLQTQGSQYTVCEGWRPWFNYALLVESIVASYGYVASMPNDDILTKTCLTGGLRHHNKEFIETAETRIDVPIFVLASFSSQRLTGVITQQGNWQTIARQFSCETGGYLQVTINLDYSVSTFGSVPDAAKLFVESSNGRVYSEFNWARTSGGTSTGVLNRAFTIWVEPGDNVYFRAVTTDATLTFAGGGTENNYVSIKPLDLNAPLCKITARCLPELTINGLLADFCNRFGLLLTVDETKRLVSFRPLNNLRLEPQDDWTDKVVVDLNALSVGPSKSTFSYSKVAKVNWYKHKNDLGSGAFYSTAMGIDQERDAFTSEISLGTDNVPLHQGRLQGPSFAVLTQKQGDVSPYWVAGDYPQGRTVWYDGSLYKSAVTNGGGNSKLLPPRGGREANLPTNSGWYNELLTNYYDLTYDQIAVATLETQAISAEQYPSGMVALWPLNGTVTFNNCHVANFGTMSFDKLIPAYQSIIQDIIAKPRLDRYLIKLSLVDVTAIDFSRAIEIGGIRYYINLVDKFDTSTNSPTVVELLRIR